MAAIRRFLASEAAGGVVLMAAAALALVAANTPLDGPYEHLRHLPLGVTLAGRSFGMSFQHWVNDGLMALFFFYVGLEIKRELRTGQLAGLGRAALPALAAVGGMAAPALIYAAVNLHGGPALKGWAIPAATDIAFALGVLALLGDRVPPALKALLMALAVIDDLLAIVIIAVFYSGDLSLLALALAGLGAVVLLALNLLGVTRIAPYVLVGVLVWIAVLKSGVHATMAGVVTALAVPMKGKNGEAPLEHLEHLLAPWIAFLVMPVFGFLNAGVAFGAAGGDVFADPVLIGIAAGLILGKQAGVLGMIGLASVTGLAPRPPGASWLALYGVAALAGIGFTMSLFIGDLAFPDGAHAAAIRIGVLGASVLSALFGYGILRLALPSPMKE